MSRSKVIQTGKNAIVEYLDSKKNAIVEYLDYHIYMQAAKRDCSASPTLDHNIWLCGRQTDLSVMGVRVQSIGIDETNTFQGQSIGIDRTLHFS